MNYLIDRRRFCGGLSMAGMLSCVGTPATAAATFASDRISVIRRGSTDSRARDVVLIAGLASGPSVWSSLVKALPDTRFHLVEIRGFAGTSAGANARGSLLDPLAAEIARYIRANGLRAPAIVGHSMGGTLAMLIGLRKDNPASRIMVVDMLPEGSAMLGGTSSGYGYLASQLNGYFSGTKAGRQLLADLVRQAPGARDSDPQVVSQALTDLAQLDLGPLLVGMKAPLKVVFAVGSDARLRDQQIRTYRAAYARAPRVTVQPIGPSGHMIMLDQPTSFAASVKAFLGG